MLIKVIPGLVGSLLVLGASAASIRAADWPMARYDANRSGASPAKLPARLQLQWVRSYPKLEAALKEQANRKGVAPEELALDFLRERLLATAPLEPRDEWERGLLAAARPCGVSHSNEDLSSEGLYD